MEPRARCVLGNHPDDGQPISIFDGRYGPYVKHGDTNATLPDKGKVESITLEEAVELINEKGGFVAKKKPAGKTKTTVKKPAASKKPAAALKEPVTKKVAAKKPAVRVKKAA